MKLDEIKRKTGGALTGEHRLLAVFGLLALGMGAAVTWAAGSGAVAEICELEKPEAGAPPVQERLLIESGEGAVRSYIVEVPARLRTSGEARKLLEDGRAELDRRLIGENDSVDYVTERLCLASEAAKGQVAVEWNIDRPEYLQYDGMPGEDIPAEGVTVCLEARLTCQTEELFYHKQVVLYPAVRGERGWVRQVKQALKEANQDGTAKLYHLPRNIDGQTVTWNRSKKNLALPLSLAVLTSGILLVWRRRERGRQEEERHREGLLRDYPAFVSSMCLFLGAGLSVRQVFYRMAGVREKQKKMRVKKNIRDYLGEELHLTCRELDQGTSEGQAYRRLGERSGLIEYRAFASLLVQNLRKGNQELLAMLQCEADKAFAERRRNAETLGSKAGTKLLMPMGLMLVVVLVLVVFPACASFYG